MNHVIFQIVFSNESRLQSHAGVAELADAYGSGPYGGNPMKVQVLSPAPSITNRPLMRPVFIYRHLNGTASEKQLRLCPITHIFGYTHLPELPPLRHGRRPLEAVFRVIHTPLRHLSRTKPPMHPAADTSSILRRLSRANGEHRHVRIYPAGSTARFARPPSMKRIFSVQCPVCEKEARPALHPKESKV